MNTLATELGDKFELLAELLIPTVLKLCSRANKVYVSSAHATLVTCINATQGLSNMISLFSESYKSPSKTLRIAACDCLVKITAINTTTRLESHLDIIEKSIRRNIIDSIPEVRDLARVLFDHYQGHFESRVERYECAF